VASILKTVGSENELEQSFSFFKKPEGSPTKKNLRAENLCLNSNLLSCHEEVFIARIR